MQCMNRCSIYCYQLPNHVEMFNPLARPPYRLPWLSSYRHLSPCHGYGGLTMLVEAKLQLYAQRDMVTATQVIQL